MRRAWAGFWMSPWPIKRGTSAVGALCGGGPATPTRPLEKKRHKRQGLNRKDRRQQRTAKARRATESPERRIWRRKHTAGAATWAAATPLQSRLSWSALCALQVTGPPPTESADGRDARMIAPRRPSSPAGTYGHSALVAGPAHPPGSGDETSYPPWRPGCCRRVCDRLHPCCASLAAHLGRDA